MKAAIYSPYLDTFGGGEKYMMTIAETLSGNNFAVDVLLDKNLDSIGSDYLKSELSKRFNLDLNKTNFTKAPVGEGSNFFERLLFLKSYNILFYLTDGSIFFPTAKRNILHIQTPLMGQSTKSLWGRVKFKFWNLIIYNSQFTKRFSQGYWPAASQVVYPPVDTDKIKPLSKKNYILSVGRFFGYLKDKKHEVLIEAFRQLFQSGQINNWSLHLVGSAGEGDKGYVDKLKEIAKEIPVNFYPNLSYDDLVRLYGQSSIYWHASGFKEEDPAKMEHFGISTVEAMAGGCVPVVIGKGGQVEIVESGKSGFLWSSQEEFIEFTLKLISNQNLRDRMSKVAIERAQIFSKNKFEGKIKEIVK